MRMRVAVIAIFAAGLCAYACEPLRSRPKHPRQLAPYARGELAFLVNTASYNVRRGA
jgi:hypothetical protein